MKRFWIGLAGVAAFWALVWGVLKYGPWDGSAPEVPDYGAERTEVAPEANAYTLFLQATNLLVESTNSTLLSEYRAGKPVDVEEVRSQIAANAAALVLVRQGTECNACITPPVEDFETLVPYISPWLKIGRVLEVQAYLARTEGRLGDALEASLTAAKMGNLIQQDAACLINYLVGIAILDMGVQEMLALAQDSAVPTDVLDRLAEGLEEVGPFKRGLVLALQAEYAGASKMIDRIAASPRDMMNGALCQEDDSWFSGVIGILAGWNYCFQPNRTKAMFAESYGELIRRAALPLSEAGPEPECWSPVDKWHRPNSIGELLRALLMPALNHLLEVQCRKEALVAGAKLAVAGNRFQRDRGRWPETLAELVPDYLDGVPRDPYDGEPFRYSAEKEIVWAVGKNLTDEGGSMRIEESDRDCDDRRDRHKAEDFVIGL